MISTDEYFIRVKEGDARKEKCFTPEHAKNADKLLSAVNALLAAYDAHLGHHFKAFVRSGYRSAAVNACIPGAAKRSHHMTGNAVDIADNDGALDKWLSTPEGIEAQRSCKLYREHPDQTSTWCHLQIVAPGSGKLTFFK
jgi:hypothetical protein